ncbi:Hypothetical predicted protein [Cloeon dipterum]|uniref:Protein kinase domain-containing protein n=1 Tax=Cloeon dipterum TaxID=197152 RepID=A0A8S1D5Y3_9INSE|nr:Hypothetical predicted protein [Cloeon dipterum]
MIKVDETDPVGELEPSFPYHGVNFRRNVDMKEFYDLQTEVGRGKFGTVYKCKEKATGLELAAKFVLTPRKEDRRNVEREVEIMKCLQHPRLIQLYDAFDNGKTMCLVLELITGGELFERVIDDDFVLTEKSCAVFMRQICEGVEFIHKQNILHLDMKPENILCLTRAGNRIKIIDFGLARKFDPGKKLQVLFGTPEFVAPEVVNFDQIGFGTDMWSVGVICYVLLSGLSPFMGETDIETMANVTIANYDFDDEAFNEITAEAKDFIERLLLKDQSARLTASECLTHPWLRKRAAPQGAAPTAVVAAAAPIVVVEEPPSPPPLDVSKENLRGFVERWGEHPNSPYVFDQACHSISLSNCVAPAGQSAHSMRVCSPSPHSSLPSSPDSVLEFGEEFTHYSFQDAPTAVHSRLMERLATERRASDSCCLSSRRVSGQHLPSLNLADEIKRLSDRLCRLIAHDLANNNTSLPKFRLSEVSRDVPRAKPDSPLRSLSSSSSQSAPSSPTRLSPEPHSTANDNRKCMRWGQIEIDIDSHTIRNIRNIFESSNTSSSSTTVVTTTTSTTTTSSECKSSKKVVATSQKQSVPLKSL